MALLSKIQKKGVEKLGSVLCPGTSQLPSFANSGVIKHADRCFLFLTEEDQQGLGMILMWLGLLPTSISRLLLSLVDSANRAPFFLAPLLRLLQIGLKGFVYSLYYSDSDIRIKLGWMTSVQGMAKQT